MRWYVAACSKLQYRISFVWKEKLQTPVVDVTTRTCMTEHVPHIFSPLSLNHFSGTFIQIQKSAIAGLANFIPICIRLSLQVIWFAPHAGPIGDESSERRCSSIGHCGARLDARKQITEESQ
jgi:hypothetical protein